MPLITQFLSRPGTEPGLPPPWSGRGSGGPGREPQLPPWSARVLGPWPHKRAAEADSEAGSWLLRQRRRPTPQCSLKRSEEIKKIFKKLRQFYILYEQKFSNLRPLFSITSPKDSKYLESLDIGLWEMGAKRPLNGVRKCDGQTDKQTNKHTDILTYIKHLPRGPML